ncbi:MAG: hypothetical protein HY319_30910 [Armatimonadetes bacterium]|nr:hypothetical protein [Armatimonadota bacterium]
MKRIRFPIFLLAAILFSGQPPCWGQPGAREREEGPPPHARTQGTPEISVWRGAIYLLAGGAVRKFDPQLKLAATAELPPSPSIERMHDMMKPPHPEMDEGDREKPPGEGPRRMIKEKMMMMRHAATMMTPSLVVDDSGVYVYAAGQIFAFDHDLHRRAVADVMPLVCPMPGMEKNP